MVTRERREVKTIKVGMNKISGSRYNSIEEENKLANVESTLCQSIGDPNLSELVHGYSGVVIRAKVGNPLRVEDELGNLLAESREFIAGRIGSLGQKSSEPLCKVVGCWVYIVDQKYRSLIRYSVKALAQKITKMPRQTVISDGVNALDSHKGYVWVMVDFNTVSCGSNIMHVKKPFKEIDVKNSSAHLVCQGKSYCLAIISFKPTMIFSENRTGTLSFELFNHNNDQPIDLQEFPGKKICGYSSTLPSVQVGRKYQTLVYWDDDSFHCVVTYNDKLHFIPSLFDPHKVGGLHNIREKSKRSRKNKTQGESLLPNYFRPGGLYVNKTSRLLRVWVEAYYFLTFSCDCQNKAECDCLDPVEDTYNIEYIAYSFPLKG